MRKGGFRLRPARVLEWRVFDRRNAAAVLALAFFVIGAVAVHNLVSRNVARANIDEYLTLFLGTQYLSPWTDAPYGVQVGEMNRWFVRLLYPLGVYYMNTRMGGDWDAEILESPSAAAPAREFRSGWTYPGGYYLKEKFSGKNFEFFVTDDFERDPNVQDYVFAMRLAFGFMTILSFSLVIYALCLRINAVAAAIYGFSILSNSHIYGEFAIFYAETVLFFLFNLAMFLYLRGGGGISHKISALYGVLSAAALSTKLMGILIAVPAFIHVLVNRRRKSKGKARDWRFELCAFAFAVSFAGINFWSGPIFDFVNETLANVYNYSGRRVARDIPLRYFWELLSDLGSAFVLVYVSIFLWLLGRWRRDLIPIYALGVLIAIVVWSLSNASIWVGRNVSLVYVAMSFVVALGAGRILEAAVKESRKSRRNFRRTCSAAAVAVFLVASVAVPAVWLPSPGDIFSSKVRAETASCGDIAALGLSEEDAVRLVGRNDMAVFERLDEAGVGEGRVRTGPEWYKKYTDFDCLVINRRGENKHISNYFAPVTHDMRIRVGNLFFFSPRSMDMAEREEEYRAAWPSIVEGAPAARSNFDVYVEGNTLSFVKESCAPRDTAGYFFLRIYPVDERNVPLERRDDAFLNFIFWRYGARFDDKCVAMAPLPAYEIARIEAGQTDGFRTIWKVEVPFGEDSPLRRP